LAGWKEGRSFEQDARQQVIEGDDEDDRVDDGFRDGAANASRAAARNEALMARHNPDDDREDEALEDAVDDVFDLDHLAQIRKESGKRNRDPIVDSADERAAQPADENRENHQERQRHRNRRQTGQYQIMDWADVHRSQRVNFLVNPHRANLRRHGGTDSPGDEDGHHDGRQFFADRIANY